MSTEDIWASLVGERVLLVNEIVDQYGELDAVQLVMSNGSAVVVSVWTDWTIKVDRRSNSMVPDYLWPPDARAIVPIEDIALETGAEIVDASPIRDDVGGLVGLRITFPGVVMHIGSRSGNITVSVSR